MTLLRFGHRGSLRSLGELPEPGTVNAARDESGDDADGRRAKHQVLPGSSKTLHTSGCQLEASCAMRIPACWAACALRSYLQTAHDAGAAARGARRCPCPSERCSRNARRNAALSHRHPSPARSQCHPLKALVSALGWLTAARFEGCRRRKKPRWREDLRSSLNKPPRPAPHRNKMKILWNVSS